MAAAAAAARKPLLRIPYTDVFPPPRIVPRHATTPDAAVDALAAFMTAPLPPSLPPSTVVLTGAGLSVASGLADYRGENGTYRVNRTFRPIYFHEFMGSHEARKRYWARSFLGWTTMHKAVPNASHYAIRDLGRLGYVHSVITQNVDSFHPIAHPDVPTTVELHGYLRAAVCMTCFHEYPRDAFQDALARLNPVWAAFAADSLAAAAPEPEEDHHHHNHHHNHHRHHRHHSATGAPRAAASPGLAARGIRTNPDGDVDLPGAPYTSFRYPPCPHCLAHPPTAEDGTRLAVTVDADGAWAPPRHVAAADHGAKVRLPGILKPAVVMFGESIAPAVKHAAEAAVDQAGRLLVMATSLATYSAWRLAKRAKDRGMPIAIVNKGGVRGEDVFFTHLEDHRGTTAVRIDMATDNVLPPLVDRLQKLAPGATPGRDGDSGARKTNPALFRDMLS